MALDQGGPVTIVGTPMQGDDDDARPAVVAEVDHGEAEAEVAVEVAAPPAPARIVPSAAVEPEPQAPPAPRPSPPAEPVTSPSRPSPPAPAPAPSPAAAAEPAAARTANGPAAPHISRLESSGGEAGQPVNFRWWAGDDDGLIRGYEVDFGDGTREVHVAADRCVVDPADPVAERQPFEHVYSEPGTYVVRLTVLSTGSCGDMTTQKDQAETSVRIRLVGVIPTPTELEIAGASGV